MAKGLDAQQKIFAANPDDRRAFEALEEHFFLEGDWTSLADLYRARLAAPSVQQDQALEGPLLLRLGQILEERILDLEEASQVYWALARLDPGNRPALRQLRNIHERRNQWDMVLQIAEIEGAITMPPYERAAFEAELAQTWLQHLADPDEAQKAFERALEADADFPPALEGLAGLHQAAGRLEEAAATLERLAHQIRGPERAPVWITLGALFTGPLADRDRARQCFAAALDDDPFQAPAVEWSLLLATEQEDWEAVSELLESRFDLAAGARHRAAIAVEASQIQLNHLGSRPGARAWIDRAIELAEDEPSVLLATADLERADGDDDALLAVLDNLITVSGAKASRAVLIEAAELHARFGNTETALASLRRASETRGTGDDRILALQVELLRETGDKRELAEALETLTAVEGVSDSVRASQLRELAALQEQDLAEEPSARATWRRAFDLEPSDPDALAALERLHRKDDDWNGLRTTLEAALAAADDAHRAPVATRLGVLLADHFDEPRRARELFEAALALTPDCRPALAGLRQLAERSGDANLLLEVCEREAAHCDDADLMEELARAVLPILQDRGETEQALAWATRWSDRVPSARAALELRADFEAQLGRSSQEIDSRRKLAKLQQGPERAATLRRQAELHSALGEAAEAGAALEQALEAEPGAVETQRALCNVYRQLERPQDLARRLRQLADDLPPTEQAEPLAELADLLQDPIGDLDTAIVVRWRLVELPEPPTDASDRLEQLLDVTGRYAELAQLLDARRQTLGDESEEAFALDLRRATLLLDSLGQCEEAAEILASLHQRHPDDEEILDQLERALRAGDDSRSLCNLLEQRAGWEEDPERRGAMQLERASLLEEALGEPLAACELYQAIAQDRPDTPHAVIALERLESLLEAAGEWERLRSLLMASLQRLPIDQQATQRERIAALCRDRLGDIGGCAEQLEAIAELESDRVHVWQQLHDIYSHELDRPADWLRVVEAELTAGPDRDREFSLRVGAARLCLDDTRRPEGRTASEAHDHYERVLSLDPSHAEAAEVLAAHYRSNGQPTEAARILELRLEHASHTDAAEADDLRLRLASLYSDLLADDDRARDHLIAAHASLGAAPVVSEPLAALYDRARDFDALSALCRQAIDAAGAEDAALPWRIRLGASEHRAGRPEEAAVAYRAALISSPDDREIEDALIEIYETTGETEPLIEIYERRLPFAREDESVDLRMRLADMHSERRNEPREALVHLRWILEAQPQRRDALERALDLAERLDDADHILELVEHTLSLPLASLERAELLERRGLLLADEFDMPERAVASFREALSLDRDRHAARIGLRAQLEQLNRWPAVLDCLFVEASEAERDRRVELLEEAAAIAWSRVGPDASLPWLARLRHERPDDAELLGRVADVHRRAGRFEAALRAIDEQRAMLTEDADRFAIELERAKLLERELHAPGRAILAYQRALELAVEDREPVLAELDRLYQLMGRSLDRADILEARVASLGPHEGIDPRQTLASIYCAELAKPELAVPHLLANVSASEGQPHEEMRHLGALDAALRACGRHDAWARVAERELALVEAHNDIRASTPIEYQRFLQEELARTYDVELGNTARALDHLRSLRHQVDASQDVERVDQTLCNLLRRSGYLLELAERLSEHTARGGAAADAWLELARLREETLHDLAGAREAYREAEQAPELRRVSVRGRRRCSERLRDWTGLAGALEDEFELAGDLQRSERTALARKLGEVCWRRLSDRDRAAAAYQSALDLDREDLEALRALVGVREAGGEIEEVVALSRRELTLLGEEGESRSRRVEVWLRIARLLRDQQDGAEGSIEAYQAAAELERLSAEDELCLARLHQEQGDAATAAEVLGRWCDRSDSGASVADHVALARTLIEREDRRAALARAERATAVAPEHPAGWILVGELEREAERGEAAAAAFERAAAHSDASEAAKLLVEAARCVEASDPDRSHDLLTQAIDLDPATLAAHVDLTRIASRRGDLENAEREAEAAIELARSEPLDDETRLEVAVLGGRAARELGHLETSRRLHATALEVDPDQVEALEGVAYADFENGDYRAARVGLERRVELAGDNPDLGLQLAMIARGLEAEDHFDGAWARYEDAVDTDEGLDAAHEGLVRVHERAGRTDEALTALERWRDASGDDEIVATAALRAAEHAMAGDDRERVRHNLDRATQANPQLIPAWVLRCEFAGEHESEDATRRLCNQALEQIEPDALAAPIALRAARMAEVGGDTEGALARYADAARWDPRCSEAVLCQSRLARMAGDWPEADAVLARFLESHPDPESPSLAQVHLERGRLLSGPLEDFEPAIDAYERALELQPELGVARTSLAKLLLHSPGRIADALAVHRDILETTPTSTTSLRALVELARERDQPDLVGGALAVLRALGVASPEEADQASPVLRFPIHPGPPMADVEAERLRRIAHQLHEELGSVLADVPTRLPSYDDPDVEQAVRQIVEIEDDLTAPNFSQLDPDERAALFSAIAALFLDPGGNGGDDRFRDPLDRAIGRWTRRKLRRIVEETSLEAVEHFDYQDFSEELRAMAAAQVIDRNGGDLRSVLRALILLDGDEELQPHFENADIATLTATSEPARRLLARITTLLCERLERDR